MGNFGLVGMDVIDPYNFGVGQKFGMGQKIGVDWKIDMDWKVSMGQKSLMESFIFLYMGSKNSMGLDLLPLNHTVYKTLRVL